MDAGNFDDLTRSLTAASSRRGFLRTLAAGLGVGAASGAGLANARKGKRGQGGKKKRKPQLTFNDFGCVDVGGFCRGKASLCCSGICEGKKPKKGKRDKRRCVAHNTGGCTAAEQSCGPATDVPCGAGGFCLATTGKAGFCGRITEAACAACRSDADCLVGFGAGAACVVCANGACPASSDRACVPAAA
jgi:hypothetical protein